MLQNIRHHPIVQFSADVFKFAAGIPQNPPAQPVIDVVQTSYSRDDLRRDYRRYSLIRQDGHREDIDVDVTDPSHPLTEATATAVTPSVFNRKYEGAISDTHKWMARAVVVATLPVWAIINGALMLREHREQISRYQHGDLASIKPSLPPEDFQLIKEGVRSAWRYSRKMTTPVDAETAIEILKQCERRTLPINPQYPNTIVFVWRDSEGHPVAQGTMDTSREPFLRIYGTVFQNDDANCLMFVFKRPSSS